MACKHARLLVQVEFEEPLQFGEEAGDSSKAVVEALQKALNAVGLPCILWRVPSMFCACPSFSRAVKRITMSAFHMAQQLVRSI